MAIKNAAINVIVSGIFVCIGYNRFMEVNCMKVKKDTTESAEIVERMEFVIDKLERDELITILRNRFMENSQRHKDIAWSEIEIRLNQNEDNIRVLSNMEITGGEPDVIGYDKESDKYIFCDCSKESPSGRRSLCYDAQAWESRKKNKPRNDAITMAEFLGIKMLSEDEYRQLQKTGDYDYKSSSWILTPKGIRELGGSLFGDKRYDTVFIYHNGAESYYASRGFRGIYLV